MSAPTVTAVIPTFKPGAELSDLLRRLAMQKLPDGERLEVLLLDSSPDPEAALTLADHFETDFHRVSPGAFGHGRTRNLALVLSDAPFFAFFTQDATPKDEHVVARLLEAVRSDEKVAGAYARQLPRDDAGARTRAEVRAWFSNGGKSVPQDAASATEWHALDPMARYLRARFDNVASLIRREALEAIPFPDTYFGEDFAWGAAAVKAGWRLIYEPRAEVVHSHERGALYEFKRTVNCHARLSALFGLRTVSTLAGAVSGFAGALLEGARQTMRSEERTSGKVGELARLPGREAARALGQYVGGALGARGWDERWHFRGI